MADDDLAWKPPSDAEMKVLQARRERQDKISKIMGEYLLKGYKMLGTMCAECETILMQDKQGRNYCIACSELDTDAHKDDPALNSQAARRLEAEQNRRSVFADADEEEDTDPVVISPGTLLLSPQTLPQPRVSAPSVASGLLSASPTDPPIPPKNLERSGSIWDMSEPLQAVNSRLRSAALELRSSTNASQSTELCQLIKACAETMNCLQKVHSTGKSSSQS